MNAHKAKEIADNKIKRGLASWYIHIKENIEKYHVYWELTSEEYSFLKREGYGLTYIKEMKKYKIQW